MASLLFSDLHENLDSNGIPTYDNSRKRVGWFFHDVHESLLQPGDHIYVHRSLKVYTHHGIYIGDTLGSSDREVIHFTGDSKLQALQAEIKATSLKEFLCGEEKVRLVAYDSNLTFYKRFLPGTSHYRSCKPAREVVYTAQFYCNNPKEWTRKWGKYDLSSNNCEHFAFYCKTGIHCSRQAGEPAPVRKRGEEDMTRSPVVVGENYRRIIVQTVATVAQILTLPLFRAIINFFAL